MTAISEVSASLSPDAEITLFQIDATAFGGGTFEGTNCGRDVHFGGIPFLHISAKFQNFGSTTQDSGGNTPSIQIVPNVWIKSFSDQFDQGRGAILIRTRTHRRFLDDGDIPDPTQIYPQDLMLVERLSYGGPDYYEWELSNYTDLEGLQFPRRTMEPDACDFEYRTWNGSTFDQHSCPYADSPMFDVNNVTTTDPTKDVCPLIRSGCEVRYTTNPMPFRGFPGMGAIR